MSTNPPGPLKSPPPLAAGPTATAPSTFRPPIKASTVTGASTSAATTSSIRDNPFLTADRNAKNSGSQTTTGGFTVPSSGSVRNNPFFQADRAGITAAPNKQPQAITNHAVTNTAKPSSIHPSAATAPLVQAHPTTVPSSPLLPVTAAQPSPAVSATAASSTPAAANGHATAAPPAAAPLAQATTNPFRFKAPTANGTTSAANNNTAKPVGAAASPSVASNPYALKPVSNPALIPAPTSQPLATPTAPVASQPNSNSSTPTIAPVQTSSPAAPIPSAATVRTCHACKQSITDLEYVSASGRFYHQRHFACSICQGRLTNGQFQNVGEDLVCTPCATSLKQCFACSQSILPISGQQIVGIDDSTFSHLACFTCSVCSTSLAGVPMLADRAEGKLYCETHAREKQPSSSGPARTCCACGDPITERVLIALENDWHPACFACCHCLQSLEQQPFTLHEDSVYCIKDYKELFMTKCQQCRKVIEGSALTIEGTNVKFHPDCLQCADCAVKLTPDMFYQHPDDPVQLLCEPDYERRFLKPCDLCLKPLKGAALKVAGRTVHSACFRCEQCGEELTHAPYAQEEATGRFYCEEHLPAVQVQKNEAELTTVARMQAAIRQAAGATTSTPAAATITSPAPAVAASPSPASSSSAPVASPASLPSHAAASAPTSSIQARIRALQAQAQCSSPAASTASPAPAAPRANVASPPPAKPAAVSPAVTAPVPAAVSAAPFQFRAPMPPVQATRSTVAPAARALAPGDLDSDDEEIPPPPPQTLKQQQAQAEVAATPLPMLEDEKPKPQPAAVPAASPVNSKPTAAPALEKSQPAAAEEDSCIISEIGDAPASPRRAASPQQQDSASVPTSTPTSAPSSVAAPVKSAVTPAASVSAPQSASAPNVAAESVALVGGRKKLLPEVATSPFDSPVNKKPATNAAATVVNNHTKPVLAHQQSAASLVGSPVNKPVLINQASPPPPAAVAPPKITLQDGGMIPPSQLSSFISKGIECTLQELQTSLGGDKSLNGGASKGQSVKLGNDYSKKEMYNLLHCSISYQFQDYAPAVFHSVRMNYGISLQSYLRSLVTDGITGGAMGDGKSGMLFYSSNDSRYVLKTVKREELAFFRSILQKYQHHICVANPHSLLPRFFGMYKLVYQVKGGKSYTYRLIVMNNLFDVPQGIKIEHKFDLKGSTRNRKISAAQIKPGRVLLDLNFQEMGLKIRVGLQQKLLLLEQIRKDCTFLREANIMDHSLLLGIHYDSPDAASGSNMPIDSHSLLEPLLFDPRPSSTGAGGSLMSIWQSTNGGVRAFNPNGSQSRREIYFLGIIDILQAFDTKKALESAYKVIRFNKNAVSAIESRGYNERFIAYLDSVME